MPSVAIIGASPKPERPSHLAVLRFAARGWQVFPIHPTAEEIAGHRVQRRLEDCPTPLDLVCMYVNPQAGLELLPTIVAAHPRGLWLNPGAESPELEAAARAQGLQVISACALVALQLGDPAERLS